MPVSEPARARPELLLAGALPGGNAGNAVSTDVMLHALGEIGDVTLLSHRVAPLPAWREGRANGHRRISLGVQPLAIHGEALAAGRVYRSRLRQWPCAWAVNSRYAGALYAAGVPYLIWEATTARDELAVSTWADVRTSARGSGLGFALHRSLLPIGERLERRIYRGAARVLAMSAHTRTRILDTHGLPPERVGVLTHPAAPGFLKALGEARPVHSSASRAEGEPWRLLFVGRADDARKNFALLPAVLRALAAAGHEATLTVIGPHNEAWRNGLALDGIADAIRFAGPIPLSALATAYLEHDLLVVPSRQEGFGIVVAEAFAAGLPVVATRCGGPEQIITESGAGELVPIDAAAMANAITGVLGDPCRRAAMRNRALAYSAGPLHPSHFAAEVARLTHGTLDRRA